LTYAGKKEKTD